MSFGFRTLHPFVLLFYYICTVTGILLYQHPFFLLFACIILILLNVVLDKGKMLKSWGKFLIILPIVFMIVAPLFNRRGNHILFYISQNPVTLESIIQGLMNGLTIIAIMLVFLTFNVVITADKFLFLFSKWFPQWALLAMLSLRFVPLFQRRLHEIMTVQKARGYSITEGPIKQRVRNSLLLLQILLTWSLEDGIETADSMAARGYGVQERTKYTPYKLTVTDLILIVLLLILTAIVIFGWWLGDGVLTLLPILEPVLLYGREWLFFTFYICLIGFPLFVEGKEVM